MEEDIHDVSIEELNLSTSELMATAPRSEFAAVIFHDIPETYPADAKVDCHYTLTSDLHPTTRDYVGLYKVGWMSYRDYIYYEWAPWPENYEAGRDYTESRVLFPAQKLKGDDGEFYQFCYVTSASQIRGASMPFQFRRPCADDFIEEEDEEADMLVIRSKTVVLEERLKRAEDEKKQLIETRENLERERESMIAKMVELSKQLESEQHSNNFHKEQLKLSHEKILQLNKEEEDMNLVREELEQKLGEITQDRELIQGKVEMLVTEIKDLRSTIKSLQNEKDELMGKNKSLEEEKELYKNHFTSSESTAQNHVQEIENLRRQLASTEEELKVAQVEVLAVKVALETEKSALQQKSARSDKETENVRDLMEMLRNVEDKLAAEEHTKKMLSEEIMAFQLTQEKMSRSLEDSELESDKLKDRGRRYREEVSHLKRELEEVLQAKAVLETDLITMKAQLDKAAAVEKEVFLLQSQVSRADSLEQELKVLQDEHHKVKECTETTTASHFALQKANETLKERLAKAKKRNEEGQGHRDELVKKQKQQQQREHDLIREAEDLRERIYMCSEEYKTLFQKNRKLQKKVDKAERLHFRSKSRSEDVEAGEVIIKETDAKLQSSSSGVVEDPVVSELHARVEALVKELEQQRGKKDKYKQLYQEERDRQELLRKHYYDDGRKFDTQIEKLKRKNADMQAEFELKYRSMQNLLSLREREMDELARARRHAVELQQDKDRTQTSPKKSDGKPGASHHQLTFPPIYPVLMFPNPYEKDASSSEQQPVCYPPQYPQLVPPYSYPTAPPIYQYPLQTYPDTSASAQSGSESTERDFFVGKADSVHVEIDCLSESEASGPLDLPLQPTVLPMAKVAAVRSTLHSTDGSSEVTEDIVLTVDGCSDTETQEKVPLDSADSPTVVPSAPIVHLDLQDAEEERYLDAAGEAMKICPNCDVTFPQDTSDRDFHMHILSHFGKICPLCDAQLDPKCTQNEYEQHVNAHFND